MTLNECSICNGEADLEFKRVMVWEDPRWRITMSMYEAVKGFCYLEPKRHIPYITELDGDESLEFGPMLALASGAIKKATGCNLLYVYIYGDHIPHLHVHLAPHIPGDIFVDDVIKNGVKLNEGLLESREIDLLKTKIKSSITQSLSKI